MNKQTLTNLLAEGKTAQVLDALRSLSLADKVLVNTILQTAARFSEHEREQHAGLLTHEQAGLERNRITAAVLHIIEQLPEEDLQGSQNEQGGKTVIQHADKIYNIGHIDNANFS